MGIEILDPFLKFVPGIKKPGTPLSFREKLKWTAVIMTVYFLLFSTPAFGVRISSLKSPLFQIINTIFAARLGSLVTVGIGPIVLASIVLQLLSGTGVIKIDMQNPEDKGRFQAIQKLAAMVIAVVESIIFASTSVATISAAYVVPVILQFILGAIIVIYLDEAMVKYGITSGINLFIAGGVAYGIVGGTFNILLPLAEQSLAQGTATAIPQAVLAFLPLVFTIVVFLISIYILDMKIELPLTFSQFRGVGGRLPIPFLYVSVLPVILATSLLYSLGVWFMPLAHTTGGLGTFVRFLATYSNSTGTNQLSGGVIYLIQPQFPTPYTSGYGTYVYQLATGWTYLYPPFGGAPFQVPEWLHFIIYLIVLVVLCIIFGKFWVEMTGQSPKNMAEQLQDVGWQIPGFRRDPRVIEGVLNNYLPTITVLGSMFVGILAAFATISGAIGGGMGVLLTAGIMYSIYQQLEQENLIESYPALNKLVSK